MHKLATAISSESIKASLEESARIDPVITTRNETARWENFRDCNRERYNEIVETLKENQHGLCGYCECRLKDTHRQIEHIIPKKLSTVDNDYTFDFSNMLLCCKGGTEKSNQKNLTKCEKKKNHSCGEAKGEEKIDITPYTLPCFTLVKPFVEEDKITFIADEKLCSEYGISTNLVEKTINTLNLNCPRLSRSRFMVWEETEKCIENANDETSIEEQRNFANDLYNTEKQVHNEYMTTIILCIQRYL